MATRGESFIDYAPVLVVDTDAPAAQQLTEQLRHRGFQAGVAISCSAARAAVRATHYGSVVVVADPKATDDLDCIAGLRASAPRSWIIAISRIVDLQAEQMFFLHGADSVLVVPFSVEDLTWRLSAFSHRSRPA